MYLEIYRNCAGNVIGSQNVNFRSNCGDNFNVLFDSPVITEVSQICPPSIGTSTCNGGALAGVEKLVFDSVISLAPACDAWIINWTQCCRAPLTNANGNDMYIESRLYNLTAPCNSAPRASQPFPAGQFCVDEVAEYDFGFTDVEGDSLNFQLVSARRSVFQNVFYNGGHSGGQPIIGMTIDNKTGHMTFMPTLPGVYVVNVRVDEYDAAGNRIGTTYRDIIFTTYLCTNELPVAGPITNITGDAIAVGSNAVRTCEGSSFCFDVVFSDANGANLIALSTNLASAMPGATMTVSGTNPATANICWTVPGGSDYYRSFAIFANDSVCPVQGIGDGTFEVFVGGGTKAGADQTICGTNAANLTANGGSSYTWSVISGAPIVVGVNFSCNPCASPQATPAITTEYKVTSNLPASCPNVDTVVVTVVPAFTQTLSQVDTMTCYNAFDVVSTTPAPPGLYSYQWSTNMLLAFPNSVSTAIYLNQYGIQYVYCETTASNGCVMTDSLFYDVSNLPMPDISISADDQSICAGTPVELTATNLATGPVCFYTLDMFDSFGNGWNGASAYVHVNGVAYGPFTIPGGFGQFTGTANIPVPEGATLEFEFVGGFQDGQITFNLYDGLSGLAFSDGPSPTTGFSWSGMGNCGSGPDYVYSWLGPDLVSPAAKVTLANPNASAFYTVIAADTIYNCTDTASIYIAVGGWSALSSVVATEATCTVDDGVISIVPGSMLSPVTTSLNAGAATAALSYAGLALGSYNLSVVDSVGCTFDTLVIITNLNSPTALISQTNETCIGDCDGSIYASATGGSGSGYVWTWDNGQGGGAVHIQLCAGAYNYTLEDGFGCETSGTVNILSGAAYPTAAFFMLPSVVNIDIGQWVNFSNNSVGGVSYTWDFGDGGTSSAVSPSYLYSAPDTFTVTLVALNSAGCADTTTQLVVAQKPSAIQEQSAENLQLFPNPTDGVIYLIVDEATTSTLSVLVIDNLGRVVQRHVIPAGSTKCSIDLSQESDGIFFVVIENEGGRQMFKIALQR